MINYILDEVGLWIEYLLIYLILESVYIQPMHLLLPHLWICTIGEMSPSAAHWLHQCSLMVKAGLGPNPSLPLVSDMTRQGASAPSFVKVGQQWYLLCRIAVSIEGLTYSTYSGRYIESMRRILSIGSIISLLTAAAVVIAVIKA